MEVEVVGGVWLLTISVVSLLHAGHSRVSPWRCHWLWQEWQYIWSGDGVVEVGLVLCVESAMLMITWLGNGVSRSRIPQDIYRVKGVKQ